MQLISVTAKIRSKIYSFRAEIFLFSALEGKTKGGDRY